MCSWETHKYEIQISIYNIVNYIYKEFMSQYYTCILSYLDRLNTGFYN